MINNCIIKTSRLSFLQETQEDSITCILGTLDGALMFFHCFIFFVCVDIISTIHTTQQFVWSILEESWDILLNKVRVPLRELTFYCIKHTHNKHNKKSKMLRTHIFFQSICVFHSHELYSFYFIQFTSFLLDKNFFLSYFMPKFRSNLSEYGDICDIMC